MRRGVDSLVAVLLSDVQVGRFGLFRPTDTSKLSSFAKGLANNVRRAAVSRDAQFGVFILGDIASEGKEEEYGAFSRILFEICLILEIPRSRIWMCPGNHDYDLKIAEQIPEQKFAAYKQFQNRFFGDPDLVAAWPRSVEGFSSDVIQRLNRILGPPIHSRMNNDSNPAAIAHWDYDSEAEIEVLSFNTACLHSAAKDSRFGVFPMEMVDRLPRPASNGQARLKIAIGHHNTENMHHEDTSALRNARELRRFLADNGFRFYLHGHQHYFELRPWKTGNHETVAIGCGAAAASHNELPEGNNQAVSIEILDEYAIIKSYTYSKVEASWGTRNSVNRLPLQSSDCPLFTGPNQIRTANADLIESAQNEIFQTFINSRFPSEGDDAASRLLERHPDATVVRIVLLNSYESVCFAQRCLERFVGFPNVHLKYLLDAPQLSAPDMNALIVDSRDTIVMFSTPHEWGTRGFSLSSETVSKTVKEHFSGFSLAEITPEVIESKKQEVLQEHPVTVAESVLAELSGSFRGIESLVYFGIVGSAVSEKTDARKLNDIDMLLILDEVTDSTYRFIQTKINEAVENRKESGIRIIPQFVDGPVPPSRLPEQSGEPLFQLHVLISTPELSQAWPSFIRGSRLLRSRGAQGYRLAESISVEECIVDDLLHHRVWGIDKLREYASDLARPEYEWQKDGDRRKRVSRLNELTLSTERIEWLAYLVSKTIRNLALLKREAAKLLDSDDMSLLEQGFAKVGEGDLKLLKELISARDQWRLKLVLDSRAEERLKGWQQAAVRFLFGVKQMLEEHRCEENDCKEYFLCL